MLEEESYFEILSSDKEVLWFSSLDDSLTIRGLREEKDSLKLKKNFTVGCWVNKFNIPFSSQGRILTINPDSSQVVNLKRASKDIRKFIRKNLTKEEKSFKSLELSYKELEEYIKTHKSDDRAYDTILESYHLVKKRLEASNNVLKVLSSVASKKVSLKFHQEYTLRVKDSKGDTKEIPCKLLSREETFPQVLIQTVNRKKPHDATSLYFHSYFEPKIKENDKVIICSFPGSTAFGYKAEEAKKETFLDVVTSGGRLKIPEYVAQSGSPVFSTKGEFLGIYYKGEILRPSYFGIGFKKILP
ncbi:MAG: hypothetical protein LUC37_03255 [Prevotella sp.]|nr:hypothetical protein [Prevotella sp.]